MSTLRNRTNDHLSVNKHTSPFRQRLSFCEKQSGVLQQNTNTVRWKLLSCSVMGAYTCSRKAVGSWHLSHAESGRQGRFVWLNHAGLPPTLLGNCELCSCQASASSRKPRTVSLFNIGFSLLAISDCLSLSTTTLLDSNHQKHQLNVRLLSLY